MRKVIIAIAIALMFVASPLMAQWSIDETVGVAGSDPARPKAGAVQGVTGGKPVPVEGGVSIVGQPVTAVTTGGDEIANEATLQAVDAGVTAANTTLDAIDAGVTTANTNLASIDAELVTANATLLTLATSALQTAANVLLTSIDATLTTIAGLDFATETTLLTRATSALQTAANALLTSMDTTLTTIAGLDFATETTLLTRATSALQTAANALLTSIDTEVSDIATRLHLFQDEEKFSITGTYTNANSGNEVQLKVGSAVVRYLIVGVEIAVRGGDAYGSVHSGAAESTTNQIEIFDSTHKGGVNSFYDDMGMLFPLGAVNGAITVNCASIDVGATVRVRVLYSEI